MQKDLEHVKGMMTAPDKEDKHMEVEFEYVTPCEPYYHIVRVMLGHYLEGKDQEKLDISAMSDYLLERASIGSVIASSLGREDPERNPEYMKLPDSEFEKIVLRENLKREVYGFITIMSISRSWKQIHFLKQIYEYVFAKAEMHC